MKTPLVSISCLTYNHAPFVRKCLDGFLMQKTTFPFEILIHDDCSTDGTDLIIREYTEKYPDIIKPLYETENKYSNGYRGKMDITFNYSRAQGKYIASCEGDDYWTDPLKLQKQVDFMEANPEYSVTFHRCKHYNVVNGTTKEDQCGFLFPKNEIGVDVSVEMFFDKWITQPLTMVFRKSMFNPMNQLKYKYYRDMHEIYHLLMNGKGYLFGFDGGIRIMHGGGIASLRNDEEVCKQSIIISKELYTVNKEKHSERYYISILQWSLSIVKMNFIDRLKVSLIILFHNKNIKKFIKNVIL